MTLIQCTRIQGNPKLLPSECWARKVKADEQHEKYAQINAGARKWGGGIAKGDYFLELCYSCDPSEMKTVEIDEGQFTPPDLKKICKKEVKKVKKQESKPKHVCKECKETTDTPHKFILEDGVCRKCYMRGYHKTHPKKTSKPKESRQKADAVESLLAQGFAVVEGKEALLDIPVEKLTLRDIAEAGGEVRIREKVAVCKVCGIKCTDADTFNMEKSLCGDCETFVPYIDSEEGKGSEGLKVGQGSMKHELLGLPVGLWTSIQVDFSSHPELLAYLEKMAKLDFRSPQMELLAILDGFMREYPIEKKEEA